MEWRFKALTRNDTLQNAAHLEFFHNDALNSSVDALVREDIQNRLDARGRNEPFVEVRVQALWTNAITSSPFMVRRIGASSFVTPSARRTQLPLQPRQPADLARQRGLQNDGSRRRSACISGSSAAGAKSS